MNKKSLKSQTIAIMGLGLIGASIALALKDEYRIIGYDRDSDALEYCEKNGIIDESADIAKFSQAICVFVCVPLVSVRSEIEKIQSIVGDGTVITDVASLKLPMRDVGGRYVGGHPLAGTERSGCRAAKAHLFENAYYAIVKSGNKADDDLVAGLVSKIGAKPIYMSADEHDSMVSRVSNLPHAAAYSLVNAAARSGEPTMAGSGFLDTTRISMSDENFWAAVLSMNREFVLRDLSLYIDELSDLRGALLREDFDFVRERFKNARYLRERMEYKRSYKTGYVLVLNIKDQTGAIATVLDRLKDEDISLVSIALYDEAREESGILKLVFRDEADYNKAKILFEGELYD